MKNKKQDQEPKVKPWKLDRPLPLSVYFNEGPEEEIEQKLVKEGIYESKYVEGVIYMRTPATEMVIDRIEKNWANWQPIPVYMYNISTKLVQRVINAKTCQLNIDNDKRLIKKVVGR